MVMKIAGFGTIGLAVGAVAGLIAYSSRRAILVGTTREAYQTKAAAAGAWQRTKAYAAGIKADALAPAAGAGLTREVENLRMEVAALRTQLGTARK